MSTFAITSHQYTITLYTSGHLQISWDVFAKKSADFMSFRISFITISIHNLVSKGRGYRTLSGKEQYEDS